MRKVLYNVPIVINSNITQ